MHPAGKQRERDSRVGSRRRRDDGGIDVVPDLLVALGTPRVDSGKHRRQRPRAPDVRIDQNYFPQHSAVLFEGRQVVRLGNRAAADHGDAQLRSPPTCPRRFSPARNHGHCKPRTKALNSRTDDARSRNSAPPYTPSAPIVRATGCAWRAMARKPARLAAARPTLPIIISMREGRGLNADAQNRQQARAVLARSADAAPMGPHVGMSASDSARETTALIAPTLSEVVCSPRAKSKWLTNGVRRLKTNTQITMRITGTASMSALP